TSGARTDREKAIALVGYVYSHVTYVRSTIEVASIVLAQGKGDCSEMSLLYVALARAAGVPARVVDGIAATEVDGKPAFGFHAWREVALEGHWVQVDPTWNEPVADATHVMFGVKKIEVWAHDLDQLRVAVTDVQHDRSLAGHADVRMMTRELPHYMQLRG